MRSHRNGALMASMLVAGMALAVTPRREDELTDEERKTPPAEPVFSNAQRFASLPGETNRQFAARMKATNTSEQST